ncbi:hypothetical protein LY78DRAFT_663248 [Colletotrichum sublineola]|uniref:DUF4419 domain-containing protein n=1 Tax=Colletotrichum sublineola TaxID=1173701 RepID=A0A066WXF1_COLSU|nr:hypothetical protein LY78DRAFT_663248 [Colletotrichum sublineola]KDN61377.1 hypothetical protein CSUB01_10217 [Colletotrichum sublineola]
MPTVVEPRPHLVGVNADKVVTSAGELLEAVSRCDLYREDILRTSFESSDTSSGIVPRKAGFSDTIIRAFQQDLHLTLRPDDVWLAILVQLNFFLNGKGPAEALRDRFVAHQGRKQLVVDVGPADLATVNIGVVVDQLIQLVKGNLRDPEVATNLLLEFSTTTENDRVTAAMTFLGTMQSYFENQIQSGCGFPSVTLLGDREDWVRMLDGLEFLSSLSDETVEWAACLSKVLENMVASFDRPQDEDVKTFWMRAVHESGKYGSWPQVVKLSGWVTAFLWWDNSGDRRKNFSSAWKRWLALDGVQFPVISARDLPGSIMRCPVVIPDDTRGTQKGDGKINAEFLAGISGFQVQDASATSVRPISGWWLLASRRRVPGQNHSKLMAGVAEKEIRQREINSLDHSFDALPGKGFDSDIWAHPPKGRLGKKDAS